MYWRGRVAYMSEYTRLLQPMIETLKEHVNAIPESELAVRKRDRERHAVRWYVLVSPRTRGGATADLEQELECRRRENEPLFEYFAPVFVEAREIKGRIVDTKRPLLYNYLFVRASESEIYRMKRNLPHYNFLPRVNDGKDAYHYPYLTDGAMRDLQWVARSYSESVPVCTADNLTLQAGDRVRITDGRFRGMEARVVARPRSKRSQVMVCIDSLMWVPLLAVESGQYEIIELNSQCSNIYAHLDNDRLADRLHEALCRHNTGTQTEEDREVAREVVRKYACLSVGSDVMHCKLYSLLLPAYTILGDDRKRDELIAVVHKLLEAVKAEQSRALMLVTLYGCTDNSVCHDRAHAIVDAWRTDERPKKSKASLIARLDDYDRCFNHLK